MKSGLNCNSARIYSTIVTFASFGENTPHECKVVCHSYVEIQNVSFIEKEIQIPMALKIESAICVITVSKKQLAEFKNTAYNRFCAVVMTSKNIFTRKI